MRIDLLVVLTFMLIGISCCSNDSVPLEKTSSQSMLKFQAVGNSDPKHRAESRKRNEVVVTFDLLPTKMSFNLPSFPCLVTENDISYYNGWTETYDENAGEGSCEPLMDFNNVYSRMWIESQNDARIVVRWRGALVSSAGIIAHKDAPQVSPYGPGDWVDESYYIYPDGIHVRKSKIYTYFAPTARPFGWDRDPPNYIFEFQEMLFYGKEGYLPEDHIETKALTLIKMNGEHTTISYDPYPVHFEPEEEELYASFGDFWNANMFVVNTKSKYHPFTIGREEGVSISPYAPERETRKGIFQSWPQNPNKEEGYDGAALGHIVHRTLYKKTKNTISQIYLSGFTDSQEPQNILVPLGRSWLRSPKLKFGDDSIVKNLGYDPAQRAYLLNIQKGKQPGEIIFDIEASENSPVFNPVFLVNNWTKDDVKVLLDDERIDINLGYRFGKYKTLELDDGLEWENVLILWINKKTSKPISVTLN